MTFSKLLVSVTLGAMLIPAAMANAVAQGGTANTANFHLFDEQVQELPTDEEALAEIDFAPVVGLEVSATSRRFAFQVLETGCTEQQHFIIYSDDTGSVPRIGLQRMVDDNCEEEPRIAFVIGHFDQLGLEPSAGLRLLNPVVLQEPNQRPATTRMPAARQGPSVGF